MSFKPRPKHLIRMLVSALMVSACITGLFACSLRDGPPPVKKKELKTLGCLKDFKARLADYFNGKATPEEMNRLADCSISAVHAFQDVVRGESRDRYTAEEIRDFFQRYFLEDTVISDSLLREIMRVKQAFLGGKTTDFSTEDLRAIEGMVETLRKISLRLLPVMPLSLARMETGSDEYVERTSAAVIDAAKILGDQITEVDSVYTFAEMGRFLDEVSRTFPSKASLIQPIRNQIGIAGLLKELLISPEGRRESVTAREWKRILQDGSLWFRLYARFLSLKGKSLNWSRGEGRARFAVLVTDALDLLARAADRHCPSKGAFGGACTVAPGIPFTLIQQLIDESSWDGALFGVKFRKTTIRNTLPTVIRHILGEGDFTQTGRGADRLTREHIERLRGLFREWVDGSRYVEGLFATLTRDPKFSAYEELSTDEITRLPVRRVLRDSGNITDEAIATANGLRKIFSETVNLTLRDSKTVVFDGENARRGRAYSELARYTWLRPLLRRVMLGYAAKAPIEGMPVPPGLRLKEFTDFIKDYWEVLTDLKFVGVSNRPEEDARRRMREAALFTQASNGDDLISVEEGVQLVLFMISADPMSRSAHARLAKLCKVGDLDELGRPTIEPRCYREHFYDFSSKNPKFSDLWSGFPVFTKFFEGLDSKRREEFLRYVETVARRKGPSDSQYFNSSETQATVVLFHYLEGIFLKFDTNNDGVINEAEANVAFSIFGRTLADMAHLDPEGARVKKVFFWLIAKGTPPISEEMNGWQRFWKGLGFAVWSWRGPDFEADRLGLLKVFAVLASSGSSE